MNERLRKRTLKKDALFLVVFTVSAEKRETETQINSKSHCMKSGYHFIRSVLHIDYSVSLNLNLDLFTLALEKLFVKTPGQKKSDLCFIKSGGGGTTPKYSTAMYE